MSWALASRVSYGNSLVVTKRGLVLEGTYNTDRGDRGGEGKKRGGKEIR